MCEFYVCELYLNQEKCANNIQHLLKLVHFQAANNQDKKQGRQKGIHSGSQRVTSSHRQNLIQNKT